MKQILFIHGGESFSNYESYLEWLKNKQLDYESLKYAPRWREWIAQQAVDCDVLLPTMPNGFNAVYDEWVIYFEKILPMLTDGVTLVGHSLGGMFLAKYFHTHRLEEKVHRIVLVAARYGGDENGSFVVASAKGVENSAREVHLFHSEDDPLVPYADMAKFKHDIPSAIVHSFKSRGHFIDSTFPEMLELIRQK